MPAPLGRRIDTVARLRGDNEVEAAERELKNPVWHERYLILKERGEAHEDAEAVARAIRTELGDESLGPMATMNGVT